MTDHDSHRDANDRSVLQPVSAPPGKSTPANVNADAETVGEVSGGFLGSVSGMALGIAGGPVGLVIGGLAGALGGWWAGKGIADAITKPDDDAYRAHFDGAPIRLADRSYEDVRPAYVAGHLAGRNPDYDGRSFEDVEADLRRGWSSDVAARCGEWPAVRGYAQSAFQRARAGNSGG